MATPDGNDSALEKDPNAMLKTIDSGSMYRYVMRETVAGTLMGTGAGLVALYGLNRFVPVFRKYTNVSAKATVVVAGAATGFTLSSDWALVRYHRFHDRPDLSGHSRKLNETESEAMIAHAQLNKWEMIKEWASINRFKLIGYSWLATMLGIGYREWRNPHLTTVNKIGHARIAAQMVTIGAIFAAFAFNEETGPFAKKYQHGHSTDDKK